MPAPSNAPTPAPQSSGTTQPASGVANLSAPRSIPRPQFWGYTAMGRREYLKGLIARRQPCDTPDRGGILPLHDAVILGSHSIFKEILTLTSAQKLNQQTDLTFGPGWTPLMYAAQAGKLEMVKLLIERGADVNVKSTYDRTALMLAAYGGHTEIVQALLGAGADPSIKECFDGRTAKAYAVLKGHREVAKML